MGHRDNWRDVEEAFARYKTLTGDTRADLIRDRPDGSFWTLVSPTRGLMSAYGAGMMVGILGAFCDGWEAGRAAYASTETPA